MASKRGGIRKGSVSDPLVNIEPGDNAKFLTTAMEVQAIGRKKANFLDAEDVESRIVAYFKLMAERDQKPTMTGLSMALGVDPKIMRSIRDDKPSPIGARLGYTNNGASPEVKQLIATACNIMTSLWEDYMQNGKINPASGIFLGKNFYGMRDEVEHVVSTPHDPADDYSADDIAKRYIAESSDNKTSGISDEIDPWDDNFVPPDDPWDDIPPE
jgi:hypothetical protein